MSMSVSAIRFEDQEKEWVAALARLNGKSFSAQVREWTLERLEDEMDAYDLREAIEESKREQTVDTGISIADFMEKYGVK